MLRYLLIVVASLIGAAGARACDYSAGAVTLPLSGRPFAVVTTPDGCWIFASETGDKAGRGNGLAVFRNIDGAFKLDREIALPGAPLGLALSRDGAVLALANEKAVILLDPAQLTGGASNPLIGSIPLGADVQAIDVAIEPNGHLLFASEEMASRIAVIDLAKARAHPGKDAIIGYVPTGNAPVGLAVSHDGHRLYATSESLGSAANQPRPCLRNDENQTPRPQGLLSVIDVEQSGRDPQHAALKHVSAGCAPVRVALSPDDRTVWVTTRGDNAVLSIETADLETAARIASHKTTVGPDPVGMAIRPDGTQVWVGDSNRFAKGQAGSLSCLDLKAAAIRGCGEIGAGRFPRDLEFLPDGKTLVVALFGDRAVRLIPTELVH